MTDEIPLWAKERACEEANKNAQGRFTEWIPRDVGDGPLGALARYIAAHEEPPVDPLREEALALVLAETMDRTERQIAAIRDGRAGEGRIELALAALRRGIEIAGDAK